MNLHNNTNDKDNNNTDHFYSGGRRQWRQPLNILYNIVYVTYSI